MTISNLVVIKYCTQVPVGAWLEEMQHNRVYCPSIHLQYASIHPSIICTAYPLGSQDIWGKSEMSLGGR